LPLYYFMPHFSLNTTPKDEKCVSMNAPVVLTPFSKRSDGRTGCKANSPCVSQNRVSQNRVSRNLKGQLCLFLLMARLSSRPQLKCTLLPGTASLRTKTYFRLSFCYFWRRETTAGNTSAFAG